VRFNLKLRVLAAFAAIYIVWGSSFLAIRVGLETIPPFLLAAIRFTTAGALLYLWTRWHGVPTPSRREWRSATLLGTILFLASYGLLFWAEQRVASGMAAVLFATMQLWVMAFEAFVFKVRSFTGGAIAGAFTGLAGVVVLTWHGSAQNLSDPLSSALVLLSAVLWAFGSLCTSRLRLPESKSMSAAIQMLVGGLLLFVPAAISGEFSSVAWSQIGMRSLVSLGYLIFMASLLAFTAYVWLMQHESMSKIATYGYVNPVIAVFVGYFLGGEPLTKQTLAGTALVLIAVFTVISNRREQQTIKASARAIPELRELGAAEDSAIADREQPHSRREAISSRVHSA
jgi:drug/metabolite transporter (DMT)-like permease